MNDGRDPAKQVAFIMLPNADDETRMRLNSFLQEIVKAGGFIYDIERQYVDGMRSLAVTVIYEVPESAELPNLGSGPSSGRARSY